MADATWGVEGFDGNPGVAVAELQRYYETEMVGTNGPRKLMALVWKQY